MCNDSREVAEAIAAARKCPEAGGESIAYCDGKPSTPLQCMEGEHERPESWKAGMVRRALEWCTFPPGGDLLTIARARTWRIVAVHMRADVDGDGQPLGKIKPTPRDGEGSRQTRQRLVEARTE